MSNPSDLFVSARVFEDLKLENARLRSAYEAQQQTNARLRSAYEDQQQANARLRSAYEAQQLTIARLVARNEDFERRLSLNSSNSSKPPSSDGLKKPKAEPRTKSQRGKSGNKPGGQKGHKGATLCQTADPAHVEDHFPPVCGQCGSALSPAMAQSYAARQVFDLPEPQPLWRDN